MHEKFLFVLFKTRKTPARYLQVIIMMVLLVLLVITLFSVLFNKI